MVYDGAVKDDQESSAAPATSPAVSETSSAAPAEAVVRAIPAHDKRLGVRHPLKHRRFRAGGKMMVEPGGVPSAPAVVEGEVEEVEASEVEEVEDEDTTSAETEMQSVDVEVSSAPASVIPVVEEMEVEGAKTELSHEAEVALALEARPEEEDEEVVSSAPPPVIPVVEEMEVEGSEMELSAEAAVALALEAQAEEEEEEVVSSLVAAQGDDNKQEAMTADSVNDMDEDKEREEKEKKERERQKERERADEVGYMSGGWKSPDGSLNCGYSSFRGKRASMEDFYDIKSSKIDDKQISLFGIFDGHGGSRAAEYLKEHLFENLMKHPEFMTNVKLAISETYKKTDSDFLDSERTSHRDDGSTASTAVLMGDHLYVANVGDSRAVISKAGKAIALSEDHKPNRSDERKRIENAGGIVMWAGTWRVGGVLAMSRAFGNRLLKQFVIAEPEIQEQEINNELEFLIIASDGLWDVVPNEDAVSLVRMEEEPEAAARKLTETAYSRGSGDNITCIVVKFQHDKMGSDSPSSSNES